MEQQFEDFFKNNANAEEQIIEDEEVNKELEEMEKELNKETEEKKIFMEKVKSIKERYDEYQEAYNYFSKYNLHRQQGEAEKCLKEINIIRKQMKEGKDNGKWKEIDFSLLPKEITPDFIYGCSYDERDRKFIEVINCRKDRLNDIKKK